MLKNSIGAKLLTVSLWLICLAGCGGGSGTGNDEGEDFTAIGSVAQLLQLEFEIDGQTYTSTVVGTKITVDEKVPFSSTQARVMNIDVSAGASATLSIGDLIAIDAASVSVTSENQSVTSTYEIVFDVAEPRSQANIISLSLLYDQRVFNTLITGLDITNTTPLPFDADFVRIESIQLSDGATLEQLELDDIIVDEEGLDLRIIAENGTDSSLFHLTFSQDARPEDTTLLFDNPTDSSCDAFARTTFDEFIIENNLWNTTTLEPGSFSECIYLYEDDTATLFGWEWRFPDNAFGVNAYPEVIYGWKPWLPGSSTIALPRLIDDIAELKVDYHVDLDVNGGGYNIAFDNWINASSDVDPTNIQFEFMIWEEASQGFLPFGDYQEDVVTSNGVYRFYMGEPDWEPIGSNWTYVAFSRVEGRRSGTVDVDELLNYLVAKGIVSKDSYLTSIEFGTEIGNSSGRALVSKFDVSMEIDWDSNFESMHFTGEHNDWSLGQDPMTLVGHHTWSIDVFLPAQARFKFTPSALNWDISFGLDGGLEDIVHSQESGFYTVEFNDADKTYKVTRLL